MNIKQLKTNPNNPRLIKDDKFRKLCKSISDFPKMMELRPIIVDADNIVLGGNMRLKALQELGFKEIPDNWVKQADKLTEDEKKQFIVKDNLGFGEWDWDDLANNWNADDLVDWGLDLPIEPVEPTDLIAEEKDKAPSIKITFQSEDDLISAKVAIEEIVHRFEGAYCSVSAGEL
jgi:hypothetical protein